MRYQVWGLRTSQLLCTALLPFLFWVSFRWRDRQDLSLSSFLHFYRMNLIVVGSIYLVLSLVWVFLMKRGIFSSRRALYLVAISEFIYEIFQAVASRDLVKMGLWLCLFLVLGLVYRWLEGKIQAAHLNPKVEWYEGRPQVISRVSVKLKIQDSWWEAGVRRMDRQGLFVFLKDQPSDRQSLLESLGSERVLGFEMTFRGQAVEGDGRVRSVFSGEQAGIGLQFLPKDLYHFSQYTALVESLRGEGHA